MRYTDSAGGTHSMMDYLPEAAQLEQLGLTIKYQGAFARVSEPQVCADRWV